MQQSHDDQQVANVQAVGGRVESWQRLKSTHVIELFSKSVKVIVSIKYVLLPTEKNERGVIHHINQGWLPENVVFSTLKKFWLTKLQKVYIVLVRGLNYPRKLFLAGPPGSAPTAASTPAETCLR
jgi:hypothetical protein